VHDNDLALKPATFSMIEAASAPLVALTAWQALVDIAPSPARPQIADPSRVRRGRHLRHPARQTPRRDCRHHHRHEQRRLGTHAWRRYGHRLQDTAIRRHRVRLRRRPRFAGRRHTRTVASSPQARRRRDRHRRPARPGVRQEPGPHPAGAPGDRRDELQHAPRRQKARSRLPVPVHARERRAAWGDCCARRPARPAAGDRPDLHIRRDGSTRCRPSV
jgi:hypothetical protein